jgi:hypothetical protein
MVGWMGRRMSLKFSRKNKQHDSRVAIPAMYESPIDIIPAAKESARVLPQINKVKTYVLAKLDGKTTKEARKIAGLHMPHKAIMESPVADMILRQYLEKEDLFKDPGIVQQLKDMWCAEEVFLTRSGDAVHKPDWTARDKALGRVLYLRGYAKDSEGKGDGSGSTAAVQINFITQPPTEAVDVG